MGTRANDIATLIRNGSQIDSDAIGTSAITAEKISPNAITASKLNIGQLGGRRNLIINGGFDVWQRGISFTTVPNQDFTADRWVVAAGTPNVNKGTLDTTYGNVLTITGTSASGVYFSQRIESPEIYQEKTLTVSFYAKASSAVNINQKIRVAHTGGNYDRDTIANFDLTTDWQRYSYTFLVNDSGGALSFDSSSYIDVQLISNSNINGITVSFAQVQVEVGDTATPFEYRSYGEELALCQRYYYKHAENVNQYVAHGWAYSTSSVYLYVDFPVTMRATPSAEYSNSTGAYTFYSNNLAKSINTFAVISGTETSMTLINQSVSGLTAGAAGGWYAPSGLIAFNSEL